MLHLKEEIITQNIKNFNTAEGDKKLAIQVVMIQGEMSLYLAVKKKRF